MSRKEKWILQQRSTSITEKPYLTRDKGDEIDMPQEGINFSGKWHKGKVDENGKEIKTIPPLTPAFTLRIRELENADENYDNSRGRPH